MESLVKAGFNVSLETSGALSIADIDPKVSIVMDLKTPGSGESHRNLMDNVSLLKTSDQVKFVITCRRITSGRDSRSINSLWIDEWMTSCSLPALRR